MKKSFLILGIIGSLCVVSSYATDIISPETTDMDTMVVRATRGGPKVNTSNPAKNVSVGQVEQDVDMLGQNSTDCTGLICRDKDCTVVRDSAGCVCKDKRGFECPMGVPVSVDDTTTYLGNQGGGDIDEIDQENIDMLPWRDLNKKYCPKGCHVLREDGALVLPIHCVDRRGNECGLKGQSGSQPSNVVRATKNVQMDKEQDDIVIIEKIETQPEQQ